MIPKLGCLSPKFILFAGLSFKIDMTLLMLLKLKYSKYQETKHNEPVVDLLFLRFSSKNKASEPLNYRDF